MKTLLLSTLLFTIGLTAYAQSGFMDHIRRSSEKSGKVVVNQDAEIDRVVNNTTAPEKTADSASSRKSSASSSKDKDASSSRQTDQQGNEARSDKNVEKSDAEETAHTRGARQRYKAMGYRIQIFTGSNSHQDKQKAQEIGNKCQKQFPMLSVYAHFVSPRWICRVGDFRSHEDAEAYARKIRESRISTEVRIVRCQVLLAQ